MCINLYYSKVSFISVSRNDRVLFISSREGFPPLPHLPYQLNAPRPQSSHFFRALLRASRDSEIVGRGGERETWNKWNARLEINETCYNYPHNIFRLRGDSGHNFSKNRIFFLHLLVLNTSRNSVESILKVYRSRTRIKEAEAAAALEPSRRPFWHLRQIYLETNEPIDFKCVSIVWTTTMNKYCYLTKL